MWKNGFYFFKNSSEQRIDQTAGWWHTNKRDLGCKLSMNAHSLIAASRCGLCHEIMQILWSIISALKKVTLRLTRTGMHYHNLKRWLSITPLIANNRVNCCLSSLSLSLSLTRAHILLSLLDILQLCTMLPLIIRSTNNSW